MRTYSNKAGQNVTSAVQETTLLDLVFALRTSAGAHEDTLVAMARSEVRSGRARLCGIYAGSHNRWAI